MDLEPASFDPRRSVRLPSRHTPAMCRQAHTAGRRVTRLCDRRVNNVNPGVRLLGTGGEHEYGVLAGSPWRRFRPVNEGYTDRPAHRRRAPSGVRAVRLRHAGARQERSLRPNAGCPLRVATARPRLALLGDLQVAIGIGTDLEDDRAIALDFPRGTSAHSETMVRSFRSSPRPTLFQARPSDAGGWSRSDMPLHQITLPSWRT